MRYQSLEINYHTAPNNKSTALPILQKLISIMVCLLGRVEYAEIFFCMSDKIWSFSSQAVKHKIFCQSQPVQLTTLLYLDIVEEHSSTPADNYFPYSHLTSRT